MSLWTPVPSSLHFHARFSMGIRAVVTGSRESRRKAFFTTPYDPSLYISGAIRAVCKPFNPTGYSPDGFTFIGWAVVSFSLVSCCLLHQPPDLLLPDCGYPRPLLVGTLTSDPPPLIGTTLNSCLRRRVTR